MYPTLNAHPAKQRTLKTPVSLKGVGLHSGIDVSLDILPAKAGTGIVFRRVDLLEQPSNNAFDKGNSASRRSDHKNFGIIENQKISVKANALNVSDTCLGTTLTHSHNSQIAVSTIEHLMASFGLMGIDNVIVAVHGPEIPIFDGSARVFVEAFENATCLEQNQNRETLVVSKPWKFQSNDSFILVEPSDRLEINVEIDFKDPAIGRQKVNLAMDDPNSIARLKTARTFCEFHTVEAMQKAGLGQGGSFDNAIVVDNGRLLNGVALRDPNEFALHKALDLIGDIALLGRPVLGRITAYKPGHSLNNLFCRGFLKEEASICSNRTNISQNNESQSALSRGIAPLDQQDDLIAI